MIYWTSTEQETDMLLLGNAHSELDHLRLQQGNETFITVRFSSPEQVVLLFEVAFALFETYLSFTYYPHNRKTNKQTNSMQNQNNSDIT